MTVSTVSTKISVIHKMKFNHEYLYLNRRKLIMVDESIDDIFKELDLIDEEELLKKAENLANISFDDRKVTFSNEVQFSKKNEIKLDSNYFFDIARDIKSDIDYISFKNLLKPNSYDLIEINDEKLLSEKLKLKNDVLSYRFKHRYKKKYVTINANEVFEKYNSLKNEELFLNDYYPYRELVSMYNNSPKTHSPKYPKKGLKVIEEFFNSQIYCDDVILEYFKYYSYIFLDKLDMNMPSHLQDSIDNYQKNRKNYKPDSIPIADRLFSNKKHVQYISKEKYDFNQALILLFSKTRDRMFVKFKDKIKFNVNLMECEILFFKAWAYNSLGYALNRMNSDNFYKIYNNELNNLVKNGNILENDFNRIYSCKQIDIDYMNNIEEIDNQLKFDELFSKEYRR